VKKLLLIAAFAVSSCTIQAQAKVEFGLKGGFSVADMTNWGSQVYGYSPIPSIHGGGLLNIKFDNRSHGFALQPEFVFSGQGAISSYTDASGYYYNFTTNLAYLNFPILLQYQFVGGWRIETGPQLGILLSANDYNYYDQGGITDRRGIYHSGDFSWVVGGSYITRSGFGFDGRVNIGLSNINNDPYPGENTNINNDVFQIGIFYQFNHPSYYKRY
jgi:hypothetical protein